MAMFCWIHLFLTFCFLVSSHEIQDTSQFIQAILLDDVMINGRHHQIEDIAIRQYNGGLFVQRILKLTNFGPFAVASMVLEIPPEKQNATKLDTSLLPLNHSKVLVPYIQAMIAAPFAIGVIELEKNNKVWNILEIGLGTGILNSFLHDVFSSINIIAIELEQKMYEIAKKYFGLIEDKHQKVIVEDGLQYLQKTASARQSKFNVIFIDACYGSITDKVICPVEAFTLNKNLKIIKKALTKNVQKTDVEGWFETENPIISEEIDLSLHYRIVVLSILAFDKDKVRKIQNSYMDVFNNCYRITDSINAANHVIACGEYRRNKTAFVRKMKKIYKKFEFDSKPTID